MTNLRRILRAAAVCLPVVFAGVVFVTMRAQPARATALTKAQWTDDVRYFARELPKRHKNAYHATPQPQFARAVAELASAIPSLQDHQIIVRLQQIAAAVGDGHTSVRLPQSFTRYPLNVYWFGKELRVIAARHDYSRALGTRLVRIGNVAISEVQSRVVTCLPSADNENDWYVLNASPALMMRPEVLHTLGVIPDLERAAFTFADDQDHEFTLQITPMAMPVPTGGIVNLGLASAAKEEPLYRQKPGETFWFTPLPDSRTLYVAWRRYQSLDDHARALFAAIDKQPPARLVIDLRQNGGGDFIEGREQMVIPIKKRATLNQQGRVFVIVGRATFSAAMVNAIDFRKETNAILVGEPIGERPNSYAENALLTLPNSRLVVSYSTRYYKFVDEDVPAVLPDKRIETTWTDFKTGRDPVMEWILSQP